MLPSLFEQLMDKQQAVVICLAQQHSGQKQPI